MEEVIVVINNLIVENGSNSESLEEVLCKSAKIEVLLELKSLIQQRIKAFEEYQLNVL